MSKPLLTADGTPLPAPVESQRGRFVRLLHDKILELDKAELDFGIYRILNRRRTEIKAYLEDSLPSILAEAAEDLAGDQMTELETSLKLLEDQLNRTAQELGYGKGAFADDGTLIEGLRHTPRGQEFIDKQGQRAHLRAQQSISGTELDQMYGHLLTFFGRYFQGGDFLTVPRRGRERYLAPYSGQDTLFHWRSKGSHYVKTATELRNYAYRPSNTTEGPKLVQFVLREADTEQNNVKGAKRFFVPDGAAAALDGETLTLPFAYRPLTEKEAAKYDPKAAKAKSKSQSKAAQVDGENSDDPANLSEDSDSLPVQTALIQAALSASLLSGYSKDWQAELLKQAQRYARKNTTDYFVHPQLGPFLRAEFDHYLLTEYLQPSTLARPEDLSIRFGRYQAMRRAASGLIDLLHQIEDFQAQLFEKRKFVLSAEYLLPVRLAHTELWPTLLQSAAQRQAWQDLYSVTLPDEEAEALAQLAQWPTLVIDTRHHDPATKYALLAAFDDLEANLDGVLVHSENYAALRTLEPTYAERVRLTYIDPPYNTGSDGFLYKDEYSKHSTWLSMMQERLQAGRKLLSQDGAFFASIDDSELAPLLNETSEIFGSDNWIGTLARRTKSGGGSASGFFAIEHDYVIGFAKNKADLQKMAVPYEEAYFQRYSEEDEIGRYFWDTMERSSTATRPYLITAPDGTKLKGKWFKGEDTFAEESAAGHIRIIPKDGGGWSVQFKQRPAKGAKLRSLLSEKEYRSNQGDLDGFGIEVRSLYPKPTHFLEKLANNYDTDWVEEKIFMDFFAGSGSFGETIIKLNRKYRNNTRFVLVEMGEYFEPVTFARIAKVMFAPDWKDGAPNPAPRFEGLLAEQTWPEWVERSPRLVQVLRLESFEDSLDALELPEERTEREKQLTNLWGDQYLLRYMLGDLTAHQAVNVAVKAFQNPWAYQLRSGQTVDLPETFNLLLGLKVGAMRELWHGEGEAARRYLLVRGVQHSTGEQILVVWRDLTEGFDPAAEREWLPAQVEALGWDWNEFGRVWVNGDSALPHAQSLDAEFRRLMMVRDEAFGPVAAGLGQL